MQGVHEITVPSRFGRVRFSFDAAGRAVAVKLRARSPEGVRGPRPAGAPSAAALAAWLAEYGRSDAPFPGRWEVPGATPFTRRVYRAVAALAPGETASYAEIARRAGSPRGMRAVGNAMARNPLPLLVPCHRVLGRAGLGGFTGGLALKRTLLDHEACGAASAVPAT